MQGGCESLRLRSGSIHGQWKRGPNQGMKAAQEVAEACVSQKPAYFVGMPVKLAYLLAFKFMEREFST